MKQGYKGRRGDSSRHPDRKTVIDATAKTLNQEEVIEMEQRMSGGDAAGPEPNDDGEGGLG
jgi:hypothetical protein